MTNLTDTEKLCGLKRADFQTTINGKSTDLFFLKNNAGNVVAITNYGGAIVAIMVPDKDGKHANIIQGHDNIKDVIESPEPYLSTLIGRYGNRICKGKFQLHGKHYQLPINNGPNSLHGGKKGFRSLAIVSGAGSSDVEDAIKAGVDLFITGEIKHDVYWSAVESGLSVLAGGHYRSEVFGVSALKGYTNHLGIDTVFIEGDTGL